MMHVQEAEAGSEIAEGKGGALLEPAGKGPLDTLRPRAVPWGSLQVQLAVGVASSLQVTGGGSRVRTLSIKDVIEKRIA